MWSIKRRRLLKEGRDIGRKYKSTGHVDGSDKKAYREMQLRPAEDAIINEEFSAEMSLQESSNKYSEIVSKPESEMKVSDDEVTAQADPPNDAHSLTILTTPHIEINDQLENTKSPVITE